MTERKRVQSKDNPFKKLVYVYIGTSKFEEDRD